MGREMGGGDREDGPLPVSPRTMRAKRAWMARRAMMMMSSMV